MIDQITKFITSVFVAALATFGVNVGTEQPKYVIVDRIGSTIEIWQYAQRVAAEYTVDVSGSQNPRGDAFRAIAGYIFGANKGRKKIDMTAPVEVQPSPTKIAMTAPVEVNKSDQQMTMRFFMPSEYKLADLPESLNSKIKLIEIPQTTVAALSFSGSTGEEAISAETANLQRQIELSAFRATGTPTAYFYNPTWTISFLRRNEVIVPVEKK